MHSMPSMTGGYGSMTAFSEDADGEAVLCVPLAWLNRVVKVTLPCGEVIGILKEQTLRDSQHVHVEAIPGKPIIPPIPKSLVQSVIKMSTFFHFSLEQSYGVDHEVRRYILQKEGTFVVQEMH